jgi:hypothetical protein
MQPLQLRVPTQLLDVCEAPALPAPLRLLLAELESEHTTFAQRGSRRSTCRAARRSCRCRAATSWRAPVPSSISAARAGARRGVVERRDQRERLLRDADLRRRAAPRAVHREQSHRRAAAAQRVARARDRAAVAGGRRRCRMCRTPLTAVDESAAIADTGVIARRLAASGALASLLESTRSALRARATCSIAAR